MDFEKLTIPELKKILDENKIDYSKAKVKDDFIELVKTIQDNQEDNSEVDNNDEVQSQPLDLASKVKSALKIEKTVTKKEDSLAYLDGRDYSQLSTGERLLIRDRSAEYESVDNGIEVKVTDRLTANWRIVKVADNSYKKLLKGKIYTLSQADYDVLKDVTVKVKTEATKNKCCGQAKYESIKLLEVVDG